MRNPLFEPVRPDAHGPEPAHRADVRFAVRAPRRARGFSLLELVVVMAIAAVVASMGILRYANALSRYRVDAACRRVIAEVARAQVEARTTGESRTLRFTTSPAGFSIRTAGDIANARSGVSVALSEEPYRITMDVNGLAGNSITFNRFGDPDGGGIITFRSGSATAAVSIVTTSGRAYVVGTE